MAEIFTSINKESVTKDDIDLSGGDVSKNKIEEMVDFFRCHSVAVNDNNWYKDIMKVEDVSLHYHEAMLAQDKIDVLHAIALSDLPEKSKIMFDKIVTTCWGSFIKSKVYPSPK